MGGAKLSLSRVQVTPNIVVNVIIILDAILAAQDINQRCALVVGLLFSRLVGIPNIVVKNVSEQQ